MSEPMTVPMMAAGPHEHEVAREAMSCHRWAVGPIGRLFGRYEDAEAIIRHPAMREPGVAMLEMQGVCDGPLYDWARLIMFNNDGADHVRLRSLVGRAFTPRQVERQRPVARRLARAHVAALEAEGDVVSSLAHRLPVEVACSLLGLPDASRVDAWSISLARVFGLGISGTVRAELERDACEFSSYVGALVEQRRRHPADDLLDALVRASCDGERLTQDELVAMVSNLVLGGHEATKLLIANAVYHAMSDRTAWDELAADPDGLAAGAVEETLRFEPPAPGVARVAREDCRAGDLEFAEGEWVLPWILAANRDPRANTDPDRFRIRRAGRRFLTFGGGAHYCLGANLARVVATEAVAALADRFPNASLAAAPGVDAAVVGLPRRREPDRRDWRATRGLDGSCLTCATLGGDASPALRHAISPPPAPVRRPGRARVARPPAATGRPYGGRPSPASHRRNRMALLTADALRRALTIRDLTDPAHGPHAVQLVLEAIEDALRTSWNVPVRRERAHPVVSVEENYDRLLIGPDAASRDARYTRYVNDKTVLRTMASVIVPGALERITDDDVVLSCAGVVYRRDAIDRIHTGEPHQLDVWRVSRTQTLDLTEMISVVIDAAIPGANWRTTPVAHPYTTGGLQIDVEDGERWVEVGECGLAHPRILERAGLAGYAGLAMGLGLDRLVMLRKGVGDIRLLRSADPRVAVQMLDLEPYVPVSGMPPVRRDLSIAVAKDAVLEDLGDRVRDALGHDAAAVESVEILSETPHDALPAQARARLGLEPRQKNVLVRVVLRHLERTLTDGEANALRDRVYAALHEGSRHEWALAATTGEPTT